MLKPSPARLAALRTLETASRGQQPIQRVLDDHLLRAPLSVADRALCTELVYGVLRLERRLNWIVDRFLRQPGKTSPLLRLLLVMGAYEGLYLTRIPPHATVSAATDLARHVLGAPISRVVNGVLRALLRESPDAFAPETIENQCATAVERLGVAWSLPDWLAGLWIKAYGEQMALRLAKASAATPWAALRINAAWPEALALRDTLTTGLPEHTVSRTGDFDLSFAPGVHPPNLDKLMADGQVSRQGFSSQRMLETLGATDIHGPLWDACAGHGGKTCALLERGVPVTLASDTSLKRLRGLYHELCRLHLPRPAIVAASAACPPLAPHRRFDAVLLDVPCSGLGTLARHPDLRRLRTPADLPGLIALQARILDAAWEHLAPGGQLFYVTCTLNPAENEQQINAFLARRTDAEQECLQQDSPGERGADMLFGTRLRKRERR